MITQSRRMGWSEMGYSPRQTSGKSLVWRRMLECVGLAMIGDGVLACIEPRRHIELWEQGPEGWQKMMKPFVQNPGMTRWVGAAEAALGFWLASRQKP